MGIVTVMAQELRERATTRQLLAGTAVSVGLLLAACGGDSDRAGDVAETTGYVEVAAPTVLPDEEIPAPEQDVVLTIDGAITNTNDGDRLELDLETLEALGTVSYSVDDPQAEGRVVEFTGVLLETVLEAAGVVDGADTLVTTALNDYAIDIPISDAEESPVLIATQADGESMPVDRFGPIRIVYPYGSHDLDPVEHDPRWIWQLRSIHVR